MSADGMHKMATHRPKKIPQKRKNSVEYVLRVFGPLTWGWFEFLRKL